MTMQYSHLLRDIIENGVPQANERTGKVCYSVPNVIMRYDVGKFEFPLVSTRKCYYKAAIAELLGYLRGYDSAAQFRAIGCNTWNANANENEQWLANPNRKGEDDMGRVYGVIGRNFGGVDQLKAIYWDLLQGIDNRGEILTFWKPDEFDKGCLRPCMHTHTFTLIGDTLHMQSTQRSCDVPLGLTFNMVQCYVLLQIMAEITYHKAGIVTHVINNAHIYEDQMELAKVQALREPSQIQPKLYITSGKHMDLDYVLEELTTDEFYLADYFPQDPIDYPFSV